MTAYKLAAAIFLMLCAEATAQTSFWNNSAVPGTKEASDSQSVTVGLKFYSDVAGSVTGIRFYKGSRNTGTHVGTLWSSSGAKLASVTFSGETSSGWQQASSQGTDPGLRLLARPGADPGGDDGAQHVPAGDCGGSG